jgi:hypothetical protein
MWKQQHFWKINVENADFLENIVGKSRISGKYKWKNTNFWKINVEKAEFLENKCGKSRISFKPQNNVPFQMFRFSDNT